MIANMISNDAQRVMTKFYQHSVSIDFSSSINRLQICGRRIAGSHLVYRQHSADTNVFIWASSAYECDCESKLLWAIIRKSSTINKRTLAARWWWLVTTKNSSPWSNFCQKQWSWPASIRYSLLQLQFWMFALQRSYTRQTIGEIESSWKC